MTPHSRLPTGHRGDEVVLPGADHDSVGNINGRGSRPAGRVALVSGGNRGLGLQIVRALAGRGLRVVLGTRSVRSGHVAVELLADLADQVAVRQLDITDAASVARLATWLEWRLGGCDVLVNNAAVLLEHDLDTAVEVDLDIVRRALETNLIGTWRLTQAIVPLMRARGYGRIVNISSGLTDFASMQPDVPAYRVSKTAVNALTRMLAAELAGSAILVNAYCPGPAHAESRGGHRPAELSASAKTAVWLATLPEGGPTGGFYRGPASVAW
jgi:NAD(P)-dependent dehydrogenase (short-subunit alcohol dehydrogenase family)